MTIQNGPLDIDKLMRRNAIHMESDYLSLTRQLGQIPRAHTLPLIRRPSLSEHILNCLFLCDFVRHQKLVDPPPSYEILDEVKSYLQYHDVEESVTGDAPYYVSPYTRYLSETVRVDVSSRFGYASPEDSELAKTVVELASQIDMLEFLLTVVEDMASSTDNSPARRRVAQCYINALAELNTMREKSHFKVDHKWFIDRWSTHSPEGRRSHDYR